MLEVDDVHVYYGQSHVLQGVSIGVGAGEVVSLLGRNGAGKTTAILSIMGYLKPRRGKIRYKGRDISALEPYQHASLGFGFVPQERGIFVSLTVRENLTVAARGGRWALGDVYKLFPRLEERQANYGSQLSGGEQQMLAIARALMLNPEILILDEPSEGLAPVIVEEIVHTLKGLRAEGLAILLVEQNIHAAWAVADRHYVLGKGRVCLSGTSSEFKSKNSELMSLLVV